MKGKRRREGVDEEESIGDDEERTWEARPSRGGGRVLESRAWLLQRRRWDLWVSVGEREGEGEGREKVKSSPKKENERTAVVVGEEEILGDLMSLYFGPWGRGPTL